jgi:hypothetical protein
MSGRDLSTLGQTCTCWSCNAECGGTDDPGSCGPAVWMHRGPLCMACAAKADAFDDDRTGAKVDISQDRVRLAVDVFGSHTGYIWLNLSDAADLIGALADHMAELAIQRAGQ